jgi:hypothetical protein
MKGFEFWRIEYEDTATACRAIVIPKYAISPGPCPRRPWEADAKGWSWVISRVQISVPVGFVEGETIQDAHRNASDLYAVGTDMPSSLAAVPDDPALPGLALLHRPEQLVSVLTPLLRGRLGSHIELTNNHLFVHRYVPRKRCIAKLELTICAASGMPGKRQCFFAKFYAAGHGTRVYKNCQQLWRCGFSRGRFTIAEPLAYDPTWQVLLLNWENGPSVRDIVLAGRDALRAVEGAARWLHRLHTCGFHGGRTYTFSHHLHILGAWERRLASAHRETGRAFGDVLDRIRHQLLKAGPLTWAPIHRDFSPEHLLVEGQRFTALDFDEFCQYDPLFDVAHFVAHLRFLALISSGAVTSLDDLAAHFEGSYASESRSFSAARLHLFAAIAYLKLAYVEAVVRHNKDGKQVVDALLGEAGRFAELEN